MEMYDKKAFTSAGDVTPDGKEVLKSVPMSGVRKQIYKNMVTSRENITPVSAFMRADMSKVIEMKKDFERAGKKVSFTPIFLKITATALSENPFYNSELVDRRLVLYKSVNIACAITRRDGLLVVPVIKNVQDKTVTQIAVELKELTAKANEGALTAEEMSGSTTAVTSVGVGVHDTCTPIVSYPHSSITGFGRIKKEAWVDEDDNIVVRPVSFICLTNNHALLFGKYSFDYWQSLHDIIEDPYKYFGVE